jgi:clan AA aspartic protease
MRVDDAWIPKREAIMSDMGIFRTSIEIAAIERPDLRATLPDVMVDTGSEYSWLPSDVLTKLGIAPVRVDRFRTADGRIVECEVGFGMISTGGRTAPTVVGFAGADDMVLLGAHALEGLSLRIDLVLRELVPSGAHPAASAA